MTACTSCSEARSNPESRLCADRCPWCQARMIQLIQRLAGVDRQTKSERCKAVIERVQLWGLDEQQVRDMAKLPELAVQPEQEEQPKRGKTAK